MSKHSETDERLRPRRSLFTRDREQVASLMDTLWGAAVSPESVFGAPIAVGDRVVITAREIGMGGGFGWGGGMSAPRGEGMEAGDEATASDGDTDAAPAESNRDVGGGGGGGGGGSGRPVAVVTVGPDGVQVTPILDKTKVGLAAIAAWSAVALALFATLRTLFGRKR